MMEVIIVPTESLMTLNMFSDEYIRVINPIVHVKLARES